MTITEPMIGILLTLIGAGLTGFLTWMAKQIVAHARYSAAASETMATLAARSTRPASTWTPPASESTGSLDR